MKASLAFFAFLFQALVLSSVFCPLSCVLAQGSLTPPGTPAPTMKSLDQIEARTPISSLPFTISSSGSYYLTKSLNVTSGDGITINANQVTLDLNGFTISSTASSASGSGILLSSGVQDIRIFNGHIKGSVTYVSPNYSGPGFQNGIGSASTPLNVRVADLTVSGCLAQGIDLGTDYSSTAADRCNVRTVGMDGINAGSVNDCTAYFCGGNGIVGITVENSTGRSTGSGRGIYADTAHNCYGDSVSGNGIETLFTASNCVGGSSGFGNGIVTYAAQNCYGSSGSGNGVQSHTAAGCYGNAGGGGSGVDASAASNCFGETSSGQGVVADIAINCYGRATAGGTGVNCPPIAGIAIGCYGLSQSGTGLNANIANSSLGVSSTGTAESVTFKYNMP